MTTARQIQPSRVGMQESERSGDRLREAQPEGRRNRQMSLTRWGYAGRRISPAESTMGPVLRPVCPPNRGNFTCHRPARVALHFYTQSAGRSPRFFLYRRHHFPLGSLSVAACQRQIGPLATPAYSVPNTSTRRSSGWSRTSMVTKDPAVECGISSNPSGRGCRVRLAC